MSPDPLALLITATAFIVFLSGIAAATRSADPIVDRPLPSSLPAAAAPAAPASPPPVPAKPHAPEPAFGKLHLLVWSSDDPPSPVAEPIALADLTEDGAASRRMTLPSSPPTDLVFRRVGNDQVLVKDLSAPSEPPMRLTADQPLTVAGHRLEIF